MTQSGGMSMKFKVDVEYVGEEDYSVYCPTLKGCWSQGKTGEEAPKILKMLSKLLMSILERRLLL